MNVFALLMVFVVAIAAVMGIAYMGSKVNAGPVVDTYGNTTNATTNATQSIVTNVTATGTQVGTGIVVLIGFAIALIIILALVYVATKYL